MAEAVMFNIIEPLLKNLGSKAIEEVAAAWGFQDQLDKLKDTANTMKDVLSDAEQRQVVDKALRLWLERLRSVVYDADDLFDEFSTIVMRKELMTGSTLSIEPEVRRFFSRYNQAAFAYKMARQVITIRGRLDDIAKDGDMFALGLLHGIDIGQPPSLGTRETYSYVAADDVIGRDEDREAIVEMLLDPNVEEKISVLSIVGMGGLGKTILAQLVFNDDKIKNHFESRFWVCVGDDVFDMKVVIAKILMSVMGEKPGDGIDELQSQLQWVIGGKKYLLVLDDLWNENRGKWLELKNLLMVGSMGSKILVTTRSRGVAKIVGTTSPYDLKGLPEEQSWSLFERMASEPGQQQLHPNLVKLGKEIVKKCANVPLAIRTLGGLLYGQEESMWLSFKENELSKIPEGGNIIMAILKISYHHLASPLKNCFAYCALFPKDYEIDKETLIYLWMAEGFIIPSYEGQSLEEVGEMYFLTLLQSCFFQDITRDEWGDVKSCKMNDLMHDLAQEVAGTETIVAKLGMRTFNNKRAHHLSFGYSLSSASEVPTSCFELKSSRTFFLPEQMSTELFNESICHQIFSSFSCLRVLDLHNLGIESPASSIGDLVHLRYLDLSGTHIKALPDSVTQLQNLQTLKLQGCSSLEILPMDIGKLINLRQLDVRDCDNLTCMPAGIGALTNLHKLDYFFVGSTRSVANSRTMDAQPRDLNALAKLRGKLHIKIFGGLKDPANEAKEANLRSKCGLTELRIEGRIWDFDEVVLDELQPPPNLRKLEIRWYRGQRLPMWASMDNLNSTLPNLVEISLLYCGRCQYVPGFHRLRFLKRLSLVNLERVEYMESSYYKPASSLSPSTLFFPSLEELTLDHMENLKGWWMEVEAETSTCEKTAVSSITSNEWLQQHKKLPSFPTLHRLTIEKCPNLKSMPLCPNVEELELFGVNKEFVVLRSIASTKVLRSLKLHKIPKMLVLPDGLQHLTTLRSLHISCNDELIAIPEWISCLTSLEFLAIWRCPGVKSLPKGFQLLTSLQDLSIRQCSGLTKRCKGPNGDDWRKIQHIPRVTVWD